MKSKEVQCLCSVCVTVCHIIVQLYLWHPARHDYPRASFNNIIYTPVYIWRKLFGLSLCVGSCVRTCAWVCPNAQITVVVVVSVCVCIFLGNCSFRSTAFWSLSVWNRIPNVTDSYVEWSKLDIWGNCSSCFYCFTCCCTCSFNMEAKCL